MKAPIEMLIAVVDRSREEKINLAMEKYKINNQLTMMGKGTANSVLGDIFSFGIIDRDIICAFVDSKISEEVCLEIAKDLNIDEPDGIVFTIPISAISSDLYTEIMRGVK